MIDLRSYEVFVAAAKAGSINLAAQKLNLCQSAVTKRVQKMETDIGVALFHRTGKGIVLTEYGNIMNQRAMELLQHSRSIETELELMIGLEVGQIRVGVGPVIERMFLPRAISEFLSKNPKIKFEIVSGSGPSLVNLLKGNKLDIIIGAIMPKMLPLDFVHIPFVNDKIVFAVRSGHPITKNGARKVSIAELRQYGLVTPEIPDPLKSIIFGPDDAEEKYGASSLTSEDYGLLLSVMQNSDMATGGPKFLFDKEVSDGKVTLVNLKEEMEWNAAISFRPETKHSRVVQEFVQKCQQVAQEISSSRE